MNPSKISQFNTSGPKWQNHRRSKSPNSSMSAQSTRSLSSCLQQKIQQMHKAYLSKQDSFNSAHYSKEQLAEYYCIGMIQKLKAKCKDTSTTAEICKILDIPYLSQVSRVRQNRFRLFEHKVYSQVLTLADNNTRLQLYISSLFWKIVIIGQHQEWTLIALQNRLCSQLKRIIHQHSSNDLQYKQLVQKLYFNLSPSLPFHHFIKQILSQSKANTQPRGFDKLSQLIFGEVQSQSLGFQQVKMLIIREIGKLKEGQIGFQQLLNFVSKLLNASQSIKQYEKEQQIQSYAFSKLSMVLFDKLSLKPLKKYEPQTHLTFHQVINQKTIKYSKLAIMLLHRLEEVLRSNQYFMTSFLPNDQSPNQKIIVTTLKRYFVINYGKINQMTIKRWITNRQYLVIWCMLICNLKVKNIFDQFIKSGLPSDQLTTFIDVNPKIAKYFAEYVVTKDRYKFKLALWDNQILDAEYLLNSYLPDLLLANIQNNNQTQ